nr:uncharacterized protein LOC117850899 [Setaria viridis]
MKWAHSGGEYSGLNDPSRMSPDDISDDDVKALLGKFFRNYQGVPVILSTLRQYDAWYQPEVSRVLAGYLAQSEEEESVAEESEDKPSPPVKKRQVVCKRSAKSASASTPEKSQGTKDVDVTPSGDEATSEEVVMTAPGVGVASVEKVPMEVPPADAGVAPELIVQAPSANVPPVPGQAVLGLLAGRADVVKEVSPVVATSSLLSNVITSVLARRQRQRLLLWRRVLDRLFLRRSVCDCRHDQLGMWRRLSL